LLRMTRKRGPYVLKLTDVMWRETVAKSAVSRTFPGQE
jgi:hypothetical protein